MPLTGADVCRRQFRLVRRGYAVEEVDAFLDEVEAHLVRLEGGTAPEPAEVREVIAQPLPDEAETPEPGTATGESLDQEWGGRNGEVDAQALRLLRLAEEMADRLVAEARAEAESLRTAALASAAEVAAGAEVEAAALVNAAEDECEQMLARARGEAAAARGEADRVGLEVGGRWEHEATRLQDHCREVHVRAEELQAFERSQLERLEELGREQRLILEEPLA